MKDPARYPLACRVLDMSDGCGSILYARTSQGRPLCTCGRYMRTAAAECHNNSIDAEALLRFTLRTLKQLVARHGNRERLRGLERARRAAGQPDDSPTAAELKRLQEREALLREEQETIEYRMAREKDDALYDALRRQHESGRSQIEDVRQRLANLESEREASASRTPEEEAEAALGLLDDVTRITDDPKARAEVNPLLGRLGVWMGLRFADAIKGKKRVVRRLQSGVITFGGTPPIAIHGADNIGDGPGGRRRPPSPGHGRDEQGAARQKNLPAGGISEPAAASDVFDGSGRVESQQAGEGRVRPSPAADGPCEQARPIGSRPEGISSTKGSRGERIRTSDLLNPINAVLCRKSPEILTFPRLTFFSFYTDRSVFSRFAADFAASCCKPPADPHPQGAEAARTE